MQDVYRSQGVNKCSTHAAQARGQQTPQKSTHRGQPSPTQDPLLLDTLRQPRTAPGPKDKSGVLYKRAKRKYLSTNLAIGLAALDSPLKKQYWQTFHCAGVLEQVGCKMQTRYCNKKWCNVCQAIRTAKMIKGYESVLKELNDKYLVTLTIRSVYEGQLEETIRVMIKAFQDIKDLFRKREKRGLQRWCFKGIRNIECTYSPVLNAYHPHFHLIVEGKDAANALIIEWLNRFGSVGATVSCQDIRKAKDGSEKELFKYVTKMTLKHNGTVSVDLYSLDVIFRALQGVRTIQPFNISKYVSEDITDLESEEIQGLSNQSTFYQWHNRDWVNIETAEALTGHRPDLKAKQFAKMVNDKAS